MTFASGGRRLPALGRAVRWPSVADMTLIPETILPPQLPIRPALTGFAVEQYRAFGERQEIELGKITLLLGRNNAGKSALCFAPVYFSSPFAKGAPVPLAQKVGGFDFGPLASAIHGKNPSGLAFRFDLADFGPTSAVELGVAGGTAADDYRQIITHFAMLPDRGATLAMPAQWPEVGGRIAETQALALIPTEIAGLKGVRPEPPRLHAPLGYEPESVDALGEFAAQILRMQGSDALDKVNEWFAPYDVRLGTKRSGEHFEVVASGTSGEAVNLLDSGAGLAQVLPLLVQVKLAKRMPRLWCIEQPELHLHPKAHVGVAELLLESVNRHPGSRLLVETHSDVIVLRLRRAVAEGRLRREDLRIYFVDEKGPGKGSSARLIPLGPDAAPEWWPDGVFAEPLREYAAIRRALRDRPA